MESPWKWFQLAELQCKCGTCNSTGLEMNRDFMAKIVHIRRVIGIPLTPTSAYRCPAHDAKVGNSDMPGNGPHTSGRAIDLHIPHSTLAYQIIRLALDSGITGIGVKQHGESESRYIHLDDLSRPPRPNLWTYAK